MRNKIPLIRVLPGMALGAAVSRARRFAASGALLGAAGGAFALAVRLSTTQYVEWPLLAYAGVLGIAAGGLSSRSIVAQVLARGAAWTIFAPTLLFTLFSAAYGRSPGLDVLGFVATSGAALLLARPMLHTESARAAFAPSRFRRWFLAASTASAAAGIGVAMVSTSQSLSMELVMGLALATSLVASAVGVMRMRAWGALLGVVTSAVTLAVVAWTYGSGNASLALTAAPGAMFALPLLIARLDTRRKHEAPRVRVADDLVETPQVRVAHDAEVPMEDRETPTSLTARA